MVDHGAIADLAAAARPGFGMFESVKRIAAIIRRENDRSGLHEFGGDEHGGQGRLRERKSPTSGPSMRSCGDRTPSCDICSAAGRSTKFIVKSSARVIVNSEATKAAFPGAGNVTLIYNGVEIQRR